MLVFNTMCKLLTALFVGAYGNKKGFFTRETTKNVSSFLLRIASPFYILYSVSNGAADTSQTQVLGALGMGVAIYAMTPVIAWLVSRIFHFPKADSRVFQAMMIFSNCGFIGIPVCQSFFGDKVVFLVSMLNLPYNVVFYTYGVYLLSGGLQTDGKKGGLSIDKLINPGTVSSILALIIYFTHVPVPTFLSDSLGFVGAVLTPMSMVCIGSNIAQYSLVELMKEKSLYLIVLARLAVLPMMVYVIFHLVGADPLLTSLATITTGMPVGSMVVMGAEEYKGNVRMASGGVALTTLFSMVSIPIMAILLGV